MNVNVRFMGRPLNTDPTKPDPLENEIVVSVKTLTDEYDSFKRAQTIQQFEPQATAPFTIQTLMNVVRAQTNALLPAFNQLLQKISVKTLKPIQVFGGHFVTDIAKQDFDRLKTELKKQPWFKSLDWSKSLA